MYMHRVSTHSHESYCTSKWVVDAMGLYTCINVTPFYEHIIVKIIEIITQGTLYSTKLKYFLFLVCFYTLISKKNRYLTIVKVCEIVKNGWYRKSPIILGSLTAESPVLWRYSFSGWSAHSLGRAYHLWTKSSQTGLVACLHSREIS